MKNEKGSKMKLPIVLQNDNGIRLAGEPDECFYCKQKVGQSHKPKCIMLEKIVKMRYIIDVEVYEPYFWNKNMIETIRNDCSWCASNAVDNIKRFDDKLRKQNSCLCDYFKAEVLQIVDMPPVRRNNKEEIV